MSQIITDFSREDYDNIDALNYSRLKLILQSPRKYQLNAVKETEAMMIGTALHMAYLEPGKFKDKYVVEPDNVLCAQRDESGKLKRGADEVWQPVNKRLKDHREFIERWRADQTRRGSIVLAPEDMESIAGMLNSINDEMRFPPPAGLIAVGDLIRTRDAEVTAVADWNGRPIKARADLITTTKLGRTVVDLKKSANPFEFTSKIWKFDYDMQAAFYKKVFNADAFVFLVLGSDSPYPVLTYNAEHFIDIGNKKIDKALEILAQCEKENYWPWGTRGVESPFPSDWIMKQYFEEESA